MIPSEHLTPREKTVIVTLARTAGTDKQVAAALNLSTGTAKVYISTIRAKLAEMGFDVKSRYNLISWAKEHQKEMEE